MSETKEVVGQLRVCGGCALSSPDDYTYLNGAARVMVKRAADDIERLERERDTAIIRAANQEARAEAAEAERDALAKARDDALEEAAKVADRMQLENESDQRAAGKPNSVGATGELCLAIGGAATAKAIAAAIRTLSLTEGKGK